jgi:hypothetical protein
MGKAMKFTLLAIAGMASLAAAGADKNALSGSLSPDGSTAIYVEAAEGNDRVILLDRGTGPTTCYGSPVALQWR